MSWCPMCRCDNCANNQEKPCTKRKCMSEECLETTGTNQNSFVCDDFELKED